MNEWSNSQEIVISDTHGKRNGLPSADLQKSKGWKRPSGLKPTPFYSSIFFITNWKLRKIPKVHRSQNSPTAFPDGAIMWPASSMALLSQPGKPNSNCGKERSTWSHRCSLTIFLEVDPQECPDTATKHGVYWCRVICAKIFNTSLGPLL